MLDRAAIAMRLKALVHERWPGYGGQRRAAEALGVLESQVSGIINGRVFISPKKLASWARILEVALEDLLLTTLNTERQALPFHGDLPSGSRKAILKNKGQPETLATADYPPGTFTIRITGHELVEHRIFDGDVLTIQPVQKAESGRYALVERQSGFVLVGCHRGRYYLLKGPKPVELPKSELVRVVGIVVQRSGTIHFGPKTP